MKKLLTALLLAPSIALAELPQELFMQTDVGKVVITVKDCKEPNSKGFNLQAYATEWKDGQVIVHKGCWTKDADIVYIWFYNEEPPIVASFKDYHFKPKSSD